MPFQRPTLAQIIDRARGDIKGALEITTILRRSFLEATARALGGMAHILHGHLVFISRQLFPDQAEGPYLKRWASIYFIQQKAATFAQLQVNIVFTAAATATALSELQRTDGVLYELDADVTASGAGTLQGIVTCKTAGDIGNLGDGETLTFTSPIADVESSVVVDETVTAGFDMETEEDLRTRVVERIRQPPQGGAAWDYIAWAKEVAGVTRAWVFPGHLGQGTVGVSFVLDAADPIIPDQNKVDEVQAWITGPDKAPVGAEVTVFAPIELVVNPNIRIKPNTQAVRDAITEEIADLFRREAQVAGAYKTVDEFYDGKIPLSKLNEAISLAAGEDDHQVVLPTTDISPTTSQIATLGTITFQTLV